MDKRRTRRSRFPFKDKKKFVATLDFRQLAAGEEVEERMDALREKEEQDRQQQSTETTRM